MTSLDHSKNRIFSHEIENNAMVLNLIKAKQDIDNDQKKIDKETYNYQYLRNNKNSNLSNNCSDQDLSGLGNKLFMLEREKSLTQEDQNNIHQYMTIKNNFDSYYKPNFIKSTIPNDDLIKISNQSKSRNDKTSIGFSNSNNQKIANINTPNYIEKIQKNSIHNNNNNNNKIQTDNKKADTFRTDFGNISFNTDSRFPTSKDLNSDEKDKEIAYETDKMLNINQEDVRNFDSNQSKFTHHFKNKLKNYDSSVDEDNKAADSLPLNFQFNMMNAMNKNLVDTIHSLRDETKLKK